MDDAFKRRRAEALWQEAQSVHLGGEIGRAIDLYTRSIEMFPTAEAHTYRGWAYSAQGRLDRAIAECKVAIELDPDFGNPYNDIGSYLMKQGNTDEAIEWLERAKSAPRYEPRHYPFINLGRIFASQGLILRAIRELEAALALRPDDDACRKALEALKDRLH